MVRKFVVVFLAVALAMALAAPAALAAKPDESPWKTTPQDLPVLKLPAYLLHEGASPAGGNPHGPDWTPPGQDKEPKPPPEPEANKWAVVIGISDYTGVQNDLWHADEDAIEMQQALIEEYGFPEDNIKLLLDRKANARAILRAIDWLAKNEDAESTVVFFFCGHGFQKADSAGWDDDIELSSFSLDDYMDIPPSLKTETVSVKLGSSWTKEPQIIIESDLPVPMTILSLTTKISMN